MLKKNKFLFEYLFILERVYGFISIKIKKKRQFNEILIFKSFKIIKLPKLNYKISYQSPNFFYIQQFSFLLAQVYSA